MEFAGVGDADVKVGAPVLGIDEEEAVQSIVDKGFIAVRPVEVNEILDIARFNFDALGLLAVLPKNVDASAD